MPTDPLPHPPPDAGIFTARSQDVSQARQVITSTFQLAVVYEPSAHRECFDFNLAVTHLGPVTLAGLGFGTESHWHTGPPEDWYSLNMPASGTASFRQHKSSNHASKADGTVLATRLHAPLDCHFSADCSMFCVYFDPHAVRQELEAELEHSVTSPLLLPLSFDCRRQAPLLHDLFQALGAEAAHPTGALTRPQVAERLGAALLTTMLHTTPHQYADALATPAPAAPRQIKRVTDAMTANPAHPFPTTELARIAGVSVRSLQRAFRDHHGVTPLTYLRNLRLDRVHSDLHTEQPPGTTLADLAAHWGFFHSSRFAAYYRQRYGTLPSRDRDH
ncbi:AraC family transcriptional regulator [Streptomyces sp. NPDC046939]|uniref:AraC family transcriptional regulator n=1 Tax=Streptomyces sp. NPDC046939 TaxID=3155376 RepID=UPI0033CA4659